MDNQIGKTIKKYRTQKGLTQEELGELTVITANYISQIERGKKSPGLSTITKLSEVLEIPITKLIGSTHNEYKYQDILSDLSVCDREEIAIISIVLELLMSLKRKM
ncbi:transcriptional regulator with XRE-family HTH domain [Lachnospiraceae bacterium PF1-21]|uniref:Helix-turn-helix domain-containing protein n=1 Tax=Ohessyouella blattaphilus TaxID=2949333 RepID=A0ABT1EGX9_9FIRM|nr:helix-turn-helix transcriptional regulator [Ohessyouella blattaphilus]MCP1109744.1 helix-turn-helix domain-containing protein [Ohessyouella blattaphilus]MCR8563138.1 helix-turn-helix domain-containing protein [Ohessyouella blattaphilus]